MQNALIVDKLNGVRYLAVETIRQNYPLNLYMRLIAMKLSTKL